MKKTLIALSALAALSMPAYAGDYAVGGAGGHSVAKAATAGISATGGLAINGNNGTSYVRNESGAAQLAGARSELTFNEVGGQTVTTPGNNGVGNNCQGNSCGSTTVGADGIEVTQINEAFVDGYDFSNTTVRDRGTGTAGIGGTVAVRAGDAWAAGGYHLGGSSNW